MTFFVNGIKQYNQEQLPLEFLLCLETEQEVRSFAEHTGIIILSLASYTDSLESFGPVFLKTTFDGKMIQIISKPKVTLKDVCLLFMKLGCDVIDVNFFVDPQPTEAIQTIITTCQKELANQREQTFSTQQKAKAEETRIYYNDPRLEKAKQIIPRLLEKSHFLIEEVRVPVTPKELRFVNESLEELKKMRMGMNFEKMKEIFEQLFLLFERLENYYFDQLQDEGGPIFPDSQVTMKDVRQQLALLDMTQQWQQSGVKVSLAKQDYASLGAVMSYLSFLKKDIVAHFVYFPLLLFRSFDYVLCVLYLLLFFLIALFVVGLVDFSPFVSFVRLGIFGGVVYLFSFLKRDSRVWLCVLWGLVVLCNYWVWLLVQHSFAL